MTYGQQKLFAMMVLRGLHLLLCVIMSNNKEIWEERRKTFSDHITKFCDEL
jgi:hypothetical protein